MEVEATLEQTFRAADVDRASGVYFRQGEMAVFPQLLPASLVDRLADEFARIRHLLVRRAIPGYKHSESLGWGTLREGAPFIATLYRSNAMRGFLERLVDAPIAVAPDWDAHACAVYHYRRRGDRVGFHYDTSFYRGARYTVLVGLEDRSTARLLCELHTREPHRPRRRISVAVSPGTVVVFHGDKLRHAVSPLGEAESRTVLTLQYVTDPRMGAIGRLVTTWKDAVAYFGLSEVLRTWRRPTGASTRLGDGR